MTSRPSPANDPQSDFAALLEESFSDVSVVRKGDLLEGTILAIDEYGIIIDVGLKRDGVVTRADIEALGGDIGHDVGDKIMVMVVSPEDRDGNLLVSIQQAIASEDWDAAQKVLDADEVYVGEVVDANRGGLIIPYGELRGFVPASHVMGLPRGLDDTERIAYLNRYVGKKLEVKIIEVNPQRRRLVLSQKLAQREAREEAKRRLLEELTEGDVVTGVVSSLRDFGAFVDLGGADGLIHVSELAWHRVNHPSEVVKVGDKVEAFVLQLDHEKARIGLSLKRLKPNPWEEIEQSLSIGQVVGGTVSRVVSFGAFVELENGIEALLHISELCDPPPDRVEDIVMPGEAINARIINLEPHRQRIGLSVRDLEQETEDMGEDADDEFEEEAAPEVDPV